MPWVILLLMVAPGIFWGHTIKVYLDKFGRMGHQGKMVDFYSS
jgi:hypothetical protein